VIYLNSTNNSTISRLQYLRFSYFLGKLTIQIGRASHFCKYVPIARACLARFTRAIPQSASTASHTLKATNRLSKFHHGTKLWASQNIFAGLYLFGFPKYGHILGKTLCTSPPKRFLGPGSHVQKGVGSQVPARKRAPTPGPGIQKGSGPRPQPIL
jgi:hypothetical protein